MPVNILRWKGGAGGDMILLMKNLTDPGSVINVALTGINTAGRTQIDYSDLDCNNLSEIQKMSLKQKFVAMINIDCLKQEIDILDRHPKSIWLKSHYFGSDIFNHVTTDLVVDASSLPFVVSSNLDKTDTLTENFDPLVSRITDESLRKKYSMFLVGQDCMHNVKNLSCQQILVSTLLSGVENFYESMGNIQLCLDRSVSWVYQDWLDKNLHRLPSQQYLDYVKYQQFNYLDASLDLHERYSLLVLSGDKFKNLTN